ncbi:MAG TPA: bifunctional proline dehydrogenase/L-glutamate gamma-semialdehyde dehydrogenase [Candidatus Lumbricidophila sp.]|nr:bifunctional proline dehydrogenase/L-glutamate gamma-semialdehyde dehydrogenase [Candidatus Lumbricidophila sp.]
MTFADQPRPDEVAALVRKWVADAPGHPVPPSATRLAELLADPNGLAYAVGFVDGVVRPEDIHVAARNFDAIAKITPKTLPRWLQASSRAAGFLAPLVPWVVVPIARRVLREMLAHLVLDASPKRLAEGITKLRADGSLLNLNLLGEAVLGRGEADRRLAGVFELLRRDDVDYVSIKVSGVASNLTMWGFDEAVTEVVERLAPLYECAAGSSGKFINLDMEEYHDLDLTIAVFTRLLDRPQLQGLRAGIVLQAYLPDSIDAMHTLQEWAAARRAAGGAPIKVRLVKGANLPLERVDATMHGWPTATFDRKVDTDANYLRMLDWALNRGRLDAVELGVAGHNLFDIAHAWLLTKTRGLEHGVSFEMLLGMSAGYVAAISADVGPVRLYTPVVRPGEFDVAIAYLVRRLDEAAAPENFLSAATRLGDDEALFDREFQRYLASRDVMTDAPPVPRRRQDRALELDQWAGHGLAPNALFREPIAANVPTPDATEAQALELTNVVLGLERGSQPDDRLLPGSVAGPSGAQLWPDLGSTGVVPTAATDLATPTGAVAAVTGDAMTGSVATAPTRAQTGSVPTLEAPSKTAFKNTPDTDPALPPNRRWGRAALARSASSQLGVDSVVASVVRDAAALDALVHTVARAGADWGQRPAAERAAVLHRVGVALAAQRAEFIEVMAAETGKLIAESDPEVSEAIDFAHYYAERARELERVPGAAFVPAAVTAVTPPWNFPLAIPAGGVLAALAAGTGVVLKPATAARRCGALLAETLWAAGVPRELLALAVFDDQQIAEQLITHPQVDRVVLTGSYETAERFLQLRPGLKLLGETSGKNAIIVTPAADLEHAAADIVKSAFGHAGQKCSAASIAILVGSVAHSERFRRQLVDAARSLRVGVPTEFAAQVGPLTGPANGKLLHALTHLGIDEEWLVEPQQLDASGRLWSPGVKTGVKPGSYFHLTEFFGPVLGIMHASTLTEAIELQNAVEYGLTAGLHSLDPHEVAIWLDRVEAGNVYVNRGTTGAIVQRQPFGGWKRSAVGAGAKVGGPNYLFGFGDWMPQPPTSQSSTLHLRGLPPRIAELIECAQPSLEFESFEVLRRAALYDEVAWQTEYGVSRDVAALGVERNVFRYRPASVTVRISDGVELGTAMRVLVAAFRATSRFTVSSGIELPRPVRRLLASRHISVTTASDASWMASVRAGTPLRERVRLVGGDAAALATALGGRADVAVYANPVTRSGRVELLPFLREQSVSITNHRFGTPTHDFDDVL